MPLWSCSDKYPLTSWSIYSSTTITNTFSLSSTATNIGLWALTSSATITWPTWSAQLRNGTFYMDANGFSGFREAGAPAVMSSRTRRRMRREQRAWERAEADRERKHTEARAKARALLFAGLDRDQIESLEKHRYFDLKVAGRCYRIHQGTHGNVRLLDDAGREVTLYCAQPNGVPTEDAMLAQKLLIESDEAAFLRVANARTLIAVP